MVKKTPQTNNQNSTLKLVENLLFSLKYFCNDLRVECIQANICNAGNEYFMRRVELIVT
jgi:hypothetical protein